MGLAQRGHVGAQLGPRARARGLAAGSEAPHIGRLAEHVLYGDGDALRVLAVRPGEVEDGEERPPEARGPRGAEEARELEQRAADLRGRARGDG